MEEIALVEIAGDVFNRIKQEVEVNCTKIIKK